MSDARKVDLDVVKRATEYIFHLSDRYRSYHDHKESMAYAGAALYVAAFGSALVTKDWPPNWGAGNVVLTVAAVTVAWLAMLLFLKYQLHRRRWAALRVAGIDKLLAKWISDPPTVEDLSTWVPQPDGRICPACKIIDYVWPLRDALSVVDRTQAVYPHALVNCWLMQATRQGTEALIHERLLISIGWLLYVALVVRTLFSNAGITIEI